MAGERIGDMTKSELLQIINEMIDEKLRIRRLLTPEKDIRTVDEVLDSVERNRWTPPPGTPSTLELLREDRDR